MLCEAEKEHELDQNDQLFITFLWRYDDGDDDDYNNDDD